MAESHGHFGGRGGTIGREKVGLNNLGDLKNLKHSQRSASTGLEGSKLQKCENVILKKGRGVLYTKRHRGIKCTKRSMFGLNALSFTESKRVA